MTAPHGPSEAVVEEVWMAQTGEDCRLSDIRTALTASWPTIYAEVRAAVVAEVLAIVEGEAAKQRRLASDAAASKGLGVMHFVAGTEADAIATAIRAQLPPVSAPGPTLPEGT